MMVFTGLEAFTLPALHVQAARHQPGPPGAPVQAGDPGLGQLPEMGVAPGTNPDQGERSWPGGHESRSIGLRAARPCAVVESSWIIRVDQVGGSPLSRARQVLNAGSDSISWVKPGYGARPRLNFAPRSFFSILCLMSSRTKTLPTCHGTRKKGGSCSAAGT